MTKAVETKAELEAVTAPDDDADWEADAEADRENYVRFEYRRYTAWRQTEWDKGEYDSFATYCEYDEMLIDSLEEYGRELANGYDGEQTKAEALAEGKSMRTKYKEFCEWRKAEYEADGEDDNWAAEFAYIKADIMGP